MHQTLSVMFGKVTTLANKLRWKYESEFTKIPYSFLELEFEDHNWAFIIRNRYIIELKNKL